MIWSIVFPRHSGSYGHRLAHLITEDFQEGRYCIECQTGDINHNILPQVYCNFEDATAKQLAKAFCSPVITNAALNYNSMRRITEELQLPLLVYQAGEALRFDDAAIELGIDGIINVMTSIKMLDGHITHPVSPIFSRDEEWLLAHKSGILHAEVSLGQTIELNDVIGSNRSFWCGRCRDSAFHLQRSGGGYNTSPLIQEGSQIFKIASFLTMIKLSMSLMNGTSSSLIVIWIERDRFISNQTFGLGDLCLIFFYEFLLRVLPGSFQTAMMHDLHLSNMGFSTLSTTVFLLVLA